MAEAKPKRRITLKMASPIVGMDAINCAVRALYTYKRPAMYKDLATAANTSETYISSALSAARDVGLTTSAGKRGLYKLTPEGEDYATLLSYGKESECKATLRKLILKSPLWSEIITFLRVSGGQERNASDLVLDIQRKLGKKWSPSMKNKVSNAYTSILEYAGLIQVNQDRITSQIEAEEEETKVPARGEAEEKETADRRVMQDLPTGPTPANFMDVKYGSIFLRIPDELAEQIIPLVTKWMKENKPD